MPKLTPCTKHIGVPVPYHWFRTQVENLEIHIERIDTTKQLGDQFTEGLTADLFRTARKSLQFKGRAKIYDTRHELYYTFCKVLYWVLANSVDGVCPQLVRLYSVCHTEKVQIYLVDVLALALVDSRL